MPFGLPYAAAMVVSAWGMKPSIAFHAIPLPLSQTTPSLTVWSDGG